METTTVKNAIERALADGNLSHAESNYIKRVMYVGGTVTPEECGLWRELQDKIWKGEVSLRD